jgi:hypothetical protein
MQLTQNKPRTPLLIAEFRDSFATRSPFSDIPRPSRFKRATLKLENHVSLAKSITSKFLIDNFKHFAGSKFQQTLFPLPDVPESLPLLVARRFLRYNYNFACPAHRILKEAVI